MDAKVSQPQTFNREVVVVQYPTRPHATTYDHSVPLERAKHWFNTSWVEYDVQ